MAQFSLYVHKGGLKPDSFIYKSTLFGISFVFTHFNHLLFPYRVFNNIVYGYSTGPVLRVGLHTCHMFPKS